MRTGWGAGGGGGSKSIPAGGRKLAAGLSLPGLTFTSDLARQHTHISVNGETKAGNFLSGSQTLPQQVSGEEEVCSPAG